MKGKKIYRHGNMAKVSPQNIAGDIPDFLGYLPTQANIDQEGHPEEMMLSKDAADGNGK